MRRCLLGLSVGAIVLAAPGDAHALPVSPRLALGRSVGSPTDGHLFGGSRLADAPHLRFLPAYASEDARWALGTLVALVDRSGRAVRRLFPDAVLSVGHLSRRGGGDIDRHASHESGRDADLSFYIRSQTHHPLYSDHMVSFRGDGTAPSWPGAIFDDARNWALVSAIVQDPHARVTYIFVAAPLRARLLAFAQHIGAPLAVRNRAAELMVQPRGSLPHDDHFHVRIGCPSGMNACVELPTPRRTQHMLAARRSHPQHPRPEPRATLHAEPAHAEAAHAEPAVTPEETSARRDGEPLLVPATAAVLAAPFDDVDGAIEPPPSTARE